MDFDFVHAMLTETRKEKDNAAAASPSREANRKCLAEALLQNRTHILAFRAKPPAAMDTYHLVYADHACSQQARPAKQRRYIPQCAGRTLDASDIVDDYYLNLLDWGSRNILAIALGSSVYLWDATNGSTSELMMVDEESGPVTSVSWAPDGQQLAVELNSSNVQMWDTRSSNLEVSYLHRILSQTLLEMDVQMIFRRFLIFTLSCLRLYLKWMYK